MVCYQITQPQPVPSVLSFKQVSALMPGVKKQKLPTAQLSSPLLQTFHVNADSRSVLLSRICHRTVFSCSFQHSLLKSAK